MRGAEALLPIQGSDCPSSDGKAELTGTYQNFESEIYGYSDGYNRDRLEVKLWSYDMTKSRS